MDERKKSEKEAREDKFAKFRVQVKNEKDKRKYEREKKTAENIKKFLDNYYNLKSIYVEDDIIDFLDENQKIALDNAKSEMDKAIFTKGKKTRAYESLKSNLRSDKTKELIDGINKALLGLKENGTSTFVDTENYGLISIDDLIKQIDKDYNDESKKISQTTEDKTKDRLEIFIKISEQLKKVTKDIGEKVKDDENKENNYYHNMQAEKEIEIGISKKGETIIFPAEETTKGTSLQILAYDALNRTIGSAEVDQVEYRKQVDKEKMNNK